MNVLDGGAWLFPGQGSQEPGMGEGLRSGSELYRQLLEQVRALTGVDFDPAVSMHLAAASELHPTVLTQLSVFTVSVGLADGLLRAGVDPHLLAGHSVGEFSALAVGGWLDPGEALELVYRRATAMASCCREQEGAMSAVLGLPSDAILQACAGTDAVLANYNATLQTVVSGPARDVASVGDLLKSAGATVVPLDVVGAFHSPLMETARDALHSLIAAADLRQGHTPMVSSIDGSLITDLKAYRALLSEQIIAPVRWTHVLQRFDQMTDGAATFLEVGPGRTLRGLQRKHDRRRAVESCSSHADVQRLAQNLVTARAS